MIELKHIVKTYDPQLAVKLKALAADGAALQECVKQHAVQVVLDDVSLQVKPGEIFAVIGKSGAGKSTLLRLINQLEQQDCGEVVVGGQSLRQLAAADLRQARRKIGMVFQHFNLLEVRTVFANVALALDAAQLSKQEVKQRVSKILRVVGLEDKAQVYPDQLSGGQKQRVAIARALVTEPDILLCDEATSALDAESTSQILQLLQQIRQRLGVTIFLITHELEVVRRICDRVAVIDAGRIVEQGVTLDVLLHPQHAVTQSLVEHALAEREAEALAPVAVPTSSGVDAPAPGQESTAAQASTCTQVVRLVYVGKETDRPLLSELQQNYQVATNILQANIENISGSRVGYMLCQLKGSKQDIEKAQAFLKQHGVEIQNLAEGV